MEPADALVWVDVETTGLNPRMDTLLEVAVLVTDSELNVLGDGVDVVIRAWEEALAGMPRVVAEMHARSGLIEAVRASRVSLVQAQKMVFDYVTQWVPEQRSAPLAGSSVSFDRGFLSMHMPLVDGWLHYRMVDVSTVKELCRRWHPDVYAARPDKVLAHRALADVRESIEELRYYRRAVFTPNV